MRMTRVSQPSGCSPGCGTTIGRPRCSLSVGSLRLGIATLGLASELGASGLGCGRLGQVFGGTFAARPIRVRDCELPQNIAFGLFHCGGVVVALMIVADEMQETVHGKMGDMMSEWLVLGAGLRARWFQRRERCRRDVVQPAAFLAGNDSTLVAVSMPRQSRLSSRIAESSVRTIASSAPLVDSVAGGAGATARRTIDFTFSGVLPALRNRPGRRS